MTFFMEIQIILIKNIASIIVWMNEWFNCFYNSFRCNSSKYGSRRKFPFRIFGSSLYTCIFTIRFVLIYFYLTNVFWYVIYQCSQRWFDCCVSRASGRVFDGQLLWIQNIKNLSKCRGQLWINTLWYIL